MSTVIQIPDKTYESYFGAVKKCIWFDVTPNYGYFYVNLNVNQQRDQNVTLQISNYNIGNPVVWSNYYPMSSNPTQVTDSTRLYHNPTLNSKYYAVQNI